MTIQEILSTTDHRPWQLPNERWKAYQQWNRVLFLHWKVEHKALRYFVPKDIEIDLFEGDPWVSLVAFTMERIRPRYLPPLPAISNVHEINIRTYVRREGKSGINFMSLEGGTRISCSLARLLTGIPYRYSAIKRTNGLYLSKNPHFSDTLQLRYKPGKPIIQKDALDIWLTERYALFQDIEGSLNEFEIHHPEWPLQTVHVDHINIDYPAFGDLINNQPDRVHYSEGVPALAWSRKKVKELSEKKTSDLKELYGF